MSKFIFTVLFFFLFQHLASILQFTIHFNYESDRGPSGLQFSFLHYVIALNFYYKTKLIWYPSCGL